MDFRVDVDFLTHPKTVRLVKKTGLDGIVWLERLWEHAARFFPETGEFTGYDTKDMLQAMLLAYSKHRPSIADLEAMIEVGYLEVSEKSYKIHDWESYQTWILGSKKRSTKARLAAQARWDKELAQEGICSEQGRTSYASPLPSFPNPREEENTATSSPLYIDSFDDWVLKNEESMIGIFENNYAHVGGIDQLKKVNSEIREAIRMCPTDLRWEKHHRDQTWGNCIRRWNSVDLKAREV